MHLVGWFIWIYDDARTGKPWIYILSISFVYILYCVCFNLYCGGFILFCNVCVCVCGGCNVCVCVGFVMCGCFDNTYTVLWLRFFLPWLRFFRAFSLSCKANARVKLVKTGHGPHSSTLVVICVVRLLFVLFGCYLCCSVVICVVLCIVCV